jgi:hypothetical protein
LRVRRRPENRLKTKSPETRYHLNADLTNKEIDELKIVFEKETKKCAASIARATDVITNFLDLESVVR